jgi:hypothetical protein
LLQRQNAFADKSREEDLGASAIQDGDAELNDCSKDIDFFILFCDVLLDENVRS